MGLEFPKIRKSIARPLQEQHRNLDFEKMACTILGGFSGGVQRKAEENQSHDACKWGRSLRLGRHPAAV